jgi:hypothetical protein
MFNRPGAPFRGAKLCPVPIIEAGAEFRNLAFDQLPPCGALRKNIALERFNDSGSIPIDKISQEVGRDRVLSQVSVGTRRETPSPSH